MHQKSPAHLGESKIARSPAFAMRQGHPAHAWMRGPAMMVNPRGPAGPRPGDVCRKRFRNSEMPRMKSLHRPAKKQRFFCLDLCKQIPKQFQIISSFDTLQWQAPFPSFSKKLHRKQQLRSIFFWEPQVQSMLHLFDVKVKECQQKLVGTFVVTCVVFVCMLASGCHKFSEAKKSGNHRNMSKISSFVKDPSNVETHSSILLAFSKDASHLRMPVSRTSGSVSASFRGSCWYVGTKMALQHSNVR